MLEIENHRHQCEVRQVLIWRCERGREWVNEWLKGVAKARGAKAADQLLSEAARQWKAGNRGEKGDWR